jgi:hypothetical protein
MNRRVVFTLGVLVLSIALLRESLALSGPARAAPIWVLIPMFALLLILLVLESRSGTRGVEPGATRGGMSGPGALTGGVVVGGTSWAEGRDADLRAARLGLWLLLLLGLVYLVGFFAAIPLFLLVYLRRESRSGWRGTLLMTVTVAGVLYLAFGIGLALPFPDPALRWQR